jgi:uncharacterized protein YjbI with pentapeptide repeats
VTPQIAQFDHGLFWVILIAVGVVAGLWALRQVLTRITTLAHSNRMTREQGQIAERFTNSVNQLGAYKTVHKRALQPLYWKNADGNLVIDKDGQLIPLRSPQGEIVAQWESWTETEPNLEIRLGGLLTLERISQSSTSEHIAVMETLCAYIRENAVSHMDGETGPRADIQMAIRILGRRGDERIKLEAALDPPYRLDLRGADLAAVEFSGGTFGPVRLGRANLHRAWLDNSSFRGADFSAANMAETWLEEADLQNALMQETILAGAWMVGANLRHATMDGVDLRRTKMRGADLQGAELEAAVVGKTDVRDANMQLVWLRGVDCSGFENLTQGQLDSTFGDMTTTIPQGFTLPLWPRQEVTYMESFEMWIKAKDQNKLA